jgi:hypothetical protein
VSGDPLRVYFDPNEIGADGYPHRWHEAARVGTPRRVEPAIKDLVRMQAGNRCVRCKHPFVVGSTPGEWSPCDSRCTHLGPVRYREIYRGDGTWQEIDLDSVGRPAGEGLYDYDQDQRKIQRWEYEAHWRVLTVHHLSGEKADCRFWNLASLCQRCHLLIQAKVHLERRWNREHSDWFKVYAAGYYAWSILGEELTREQTMERLDELLALEHTQQRLW